MKILKEQSFSYNVILEDKEGKRKYLIFKSHNNPSKLEKYRLCDVKDKRIVDIFYKIDFNNWYIYSYSKFNENDYNQRNFLGIINEKMELIKLYKFLPIKIGIEFCGKVTYYGNLNKHIFNLTKKCEFIRIKK